MFTAMVLWYVLCHHHQYSSTDFWIGHVTESEFCLKCKDKCIEKVFSVL